MSHIPFSKAQLQSQIRQLNRIFQQCLKKQDMYSLNTIQFKHILTKMTFITYISNKYINNQIQLESPQTNQIIGSDMNHQINQEHQFIECIKVQQEINLNNLQEETQNKLIPQHAINMEIQKQNQNIDQSYVLLKEQRSISFQEYQQSDSLSLRQIDVNHQQLKNDKKYKRGPYNRYTKKQKEMVVKLYKQGQSISTISRLKGIPQKNIKRWAQDGIDRRKGAGRKVQDPQMEKKLYQWIVNVIQNGERVQYDDVIKQALILSTKHDFKASRGWYSKFCRRYSIKMKTNDLGMSQNDQ